MGRKIWEGKKINRFLFAELTNQKGEKYRAQGRNIKSTQPHSLTCKHTGKREGLQKEKERNESAVRSQRLHDRTKQQHGSNVVFSMLTR